MACERLLSPHLRLCTLRIHFVVKFQQMIGQIDFPHHWFVLSPFNSLHVTSMSFQTISFHVVVHLIVDRFIGTLLLHTYIFHSNRRFGAFFFSLGCILLFPHGSAKYYSLMKFEDMERKISYKWPQRASMDHIQYFVVREPMNRQGFQNSRGSNGTILRAIKKKKWGTSSTEFDTSKIKFRVPNKTHSWVSKKSASKRSTRLCQLTRWRKKTKLHFLCLWSEVHSGAITVFGPVGDNGGSWAEWIRANFVKMKDIKFRTKEPTGEDIYGNRSSPDGLNLRIG